MTGWAPVAAALLVVSAAFKFGADWGAARMEARHDAATQQRQAALVQGADALSMRALELQQMQAALTARAQEAEDAARNAFDTCRVPDPDSLQRLERRWGRPDHP